jgi:hypothetical protein
MRVKYYSPHLMGHVSTVGNKVIAQTNVQQGPRDQQSPKETIATDRRRRTSRKCLKCSKRGHLAKECWTKDPKKKEAETQEKRNEGEVGATGIDKVVQKYLLNTVDDDGVMDTDQLIGTDNGIMDVDQSTDTDSGMEDTDQWIDVQEYLLSTVDDGNIEDTDLWIADTGATVHMTPYIDKLSNIKSQGLDIITMGNGSQEEVKVIRDVMGIVGDKKEEKHI